MRLDFEPIDEFAFSTNVNNLLNSMLQIDPDDRPSINALIKFPLIWEKVGGLLSEQVYKDEFSFSTVSGQNVYQMAKTKLADK